MADATIHSEKKLLHWGDMLYVQYMRAKMPYLAESFCRTGRLAVLRRVSGTSLMSSIRAYLVNR